MILISGERGEVFWLDNDWHKLDTNKNFVTPEELEELAEKYNEESHQHIDYSIMNLKHLLPYMVKEKWFDSISFDNLALKQLDVKNLVPQDKWDMFYMGDEGTMYVDMVNREFAANSTSETRYPLLDNVEDMLKVIHQEKKGKDID